LIGFLPFSIWTLKNKLTFGYTSVEFSIHPLLLDNLKEGIKTVFSWFYLDRLPFKISLILLVLILGIIISTFIYVSIKYKKRRTDDVNDTNNDADNTYKIRARVTNIFLIFIFLYIIEILLAQSFYVADLRMDGRIMIPVFISAFIVIVLLVKKSLDYFKNKKNVKFIIFIFCEIIFMVLLVNMILGIKGFSEEGQYYTSKEWFNSDTIKELKSINSNEVIYTNNPCAIYFYLDENPNLLPTKINIYTNKKNINYTGDLNKTIEEIRKKDALIVLFDTGQYYLTEEKELLKDYELILIKDTQDGAIYKVK